MAKEHERFQEITYERKWQNKRYSTNNMKLISPSLTWNGVRGQGGGPEQANAIEKEILGKSSNEGVPILVFFSFRCLGFCGVCVVAVGSFCLEIGFAVSQTGLPRSWGLPWPSGPQSIIVSAPLHLCFRQTPGNTLFPTHPPDPWSWVFSFWFCEFCFIAQTGFTSDVSSSSYPLILPYLPLRLQLFGPRPSRSWHLKDKDKTHFLSRSLDKSNKIIKDYVDGENIPRW